MQVFSVMGLCAFHKRLPLTSPVQVCADLHKHTQPLFLFFHLPLSPGAACSPEHNCAAISVLSSPRAGF